MKKFTLTLSLLLLHTAILYAQTDWHIDGNGGTIPDSNFIGTTDAKALIFKVNNLRSGLIDFTYGNASFGYQAMFNNTSAGNGTSAFGYKALFANTTGYRNTAVGSSALQENTTGHLNTGLGMYAAYHITTGSYNTSVGAQNMFYNKTGEANTSVGVNSMFNLISGSRNAAIGVNSLFNNKSGNSNSVFGSYSMQYSVSGNNNTAAGSFALAKNTTGSYNTAVGDSALYANTAGNYNTAVGKEAGPTSPNFKNTAALGYKAVPASSNAVRIGNGSIVSIGGQVNWTVFSDERVKKNIKENVPGLAFIKDLRPVTYQYDITKENSLLGLKNESAKEEDSKEIEKIHFTGLIAQEVDKAATKSGYDFSGVDKSGPVMGLRYTEFIVPVIKAVQELAVQNDELKRNNDLLQQQINELRNMIQNSVAKTKEWSGALLEQNKPNPANTTTTIPYHIPGSAISAKLVITDNNGSTVKSFIINEKGNGQITVDVSTLNAAIYYYTLFVDGKKADSKKMILMK